MRLIDADELKKVITQDWFLDILLTQTSKHDMAKNLVNMIDSVPLAYNVDAVVEEIKKLERPHSAEEWFADVKLRKAIKIVRRGGV